VYDSVLNTWVLFLQKEFFQEKVLLEKTKQEQKSVPSFAYYKNTVSVTNQNKELKNQVKLLWQSENDLQDFTTYLELSIGEVVYINEEQIKKFGKKAALKERLNLVSEPLLTAFIGSKCLILESRDERNKKDFEPDMSLTLDEIENYRYNTVLLNLNVTELNQKIFKEKLFDL